MTAVLLALGGALTFGIADFAGGLAALRARALLVTAVSQVVGLLVLLPALAVLEGTPSTPALALGTLAGVCGTLGVAVYYRALAIGPMGVVSPLAAAVGAVVPLGAGLAAGERPGPLALGGVVLAVAAVALATAAGSRTTGGDSPDAAPPRAPRQPGDASGPLLGLLAGLAFGAFFVVLDATPTDSGLWPLLGARSFAVVVLLPVLILLGQASERRVAGFPWRLVVTAGALDMTANVLFLLATREGLLSLSGVLVSLYPVVVVLAAALVLHERLSRQQLAGATVALAAALLIALG